MKKRMTAMAAAVILVLSCLLLTACGDSGKKTHYSETFNGKISEQSYETKDEAAEEFLQAEVCGETTQAEFVRYEKTGDVSKKELESLGLEEEVTSAEWGVVVYVESDVQTFAAKPSAKEKSQKLIALQIGNKFKYWVPALSDGETVTKSYFEDVVDSEKYTNCTVTAKSKMKGKLEMSMDMSGGVNMPAMQPISLNEEVTLTMRIDGSVAEVTQKAMGNTDKMYYVRTNKGMVVVMTVDKSDYMVMPFGFDEFTALVNGAIAGVDHTYFVKTKTGFMLNEDRSEEYMRVGLAAAIENYDLEEMMNSLYGQVGLDFQISVEKFDLDFLELRSAGFSVTVSDGKINTASSKLSGKMSADITMNMMGNKMSISETIDYTDCSQTYTYSDFGSTRASLPTAARNAVERLGYTIL